MTNYKKYFPIFEHQPNLHYLDSGATTLKPDTVIKAVDEYYGEYSANIHRGLYPLSEKATYQYELARQKVAKFIGVSSDEVVFTSGATMSLNMVALGWAEINVQPGEEIVVTEMEHHSNLVPWQELARRKNLILKYLGLSDWGISLEEIKKIITKKTRILAITQVSNVLGTVNQIKEIIEEAKKIAPDICVVVDGAQAIGHLEVDVGIMGADFYAFSGHKMYGPTGIGILWAKNRRWQEMSPVFFGGGMIETVEKFQSIWASGPEKFEAGTPPIAEAIGLGAAVDWVEAVGRENIKNHEKQLTKLLIDSLKELEWIQILGKNHDVNRLGVVSMYTREKGMGTSHDMADILARDNVCVRAGHHCTMPLHASFGVETGTARASLGIYNDEADIEALINGLKKSWTIFTKK